MIKPSARFVSRLTKKTIAIVLAGGRGTRLEDLTEWRAKPAVPFAGKYRIIDFTLSNCVNSNIRKICVLTQYKSHYLIKHIQQGWSNFNIEHGEFVDLIPAQQWLDEDSWYQGTADAVFQSLDIIESHAPQNLLILAGDHIYNMDYGEMLAAHAETEADFTISCKPVPLQEAKEYGVMQVDNNYRIIDFTEKPADPKPMPDNPDMALVSMGIYAFSRDYLHDNLVRDASESGSSHDFGHDLIPFAIQQGHKVHAYPFHNPVSGSMDYWRDVGTVDAYYQANLELLSPDPPINLGDPDWPVLTYQQQLAPARFIGNQTDSQLNNVLASGGCVVDRSTISNSILYSKARVGRGCNITDSLLLPECEVGAGSRLTKVILDNGCKLPAGSVIGEDHDEDRKRFKVTDSGVVVVTRMMLGARGLQPRLDALAASGLSV